MLMLGAWQVTLLGICFVLVCLFMMLVILIQKPRGGGLSGAFGGAGGAQAAFGAKTGDVLTWFTVVCFSAFLLLAVGLTWMIDPGNELDAPSLEPVDAQPEPESNQTNQPPATDTAPPAAATGEPEPPAAAETTP